MSLVAALGYFILQNQKLISNLSQDKQLTSPGTNVTESSPSTLPSPSPSPTLTKQQLESNIQDAINSKNFAALETYMTTPKVNFIIMSTECCQPQTPEEAISQLNYIESGIPLNFDQNNSTIKNLKSKNERLKNAYLGISNQKEHLVAFTTDSGKISAVEVSISWKLYEQ